MSCGELTPAFNKDTNEYTVMTTKDVTEFTVLATPEVTESTVTVMEHIHLIQIRKNK